MPTSPPAESVGAEPAAPVPNASRRLGAGEVAVVIAAIAAVTLLAVLQRPIPAVLAGLATAAGLLLVPRLGDLLGALTGGGRG